MFDDDDDGDERDARGRWKKGHCPNPNGRPRKKPDISEADVHYFMTRTVKVTVNGEERFLTRQELLLQKMFEQALKGSVTLQRKLFDRFEQSDETYAKARLELADIGKKILAHYYKTGRTEEKDIEEYSELATLLGKDINRPVRQPRRSRAKPKSLGRYANWRKGPKPEWVLEQERLWAEEEAAERARKAALGKTKKGSEGGENN